MSFLKSLKSGWMRFVEGFMRVQTVILLSIIYHLALGPVSLLARLFGKPLLTPELPPDPSGSTYATPVPKISLTIEDAEKQF